MKGIKGFNVFKNDRFIGFIPTRSLAGCKRFIFKDNGVFIGAHMGEWRRTLTIRPENAKKTCYEYEYATTVGAYIKFSPAVE